MRSRVGSMSEVAVGRGRAVRTVPILLGAAGGGATIVPTLGWVRTTPARCSSCKALAHCGSVLISGAGVAGPALAYWLHRRGVTVTVVERAPSLRAGGQAVDVRGVALDVIDRMGLTDQLRRARRTATTSRCFGRT
jgi:NADPH-dependent 2,4-dienoyl-CoA reductase/sulfur reductase-like enzyme